MFYHFINSGKFRFQRILVNCIIVTSYIITLKGCMTTDISYVAPETIDSFTLENISLIVLKSRLTIDCKNREVKLEKINDSTSYFALMPVIGITDTTIGEKQLIPINDVLRIQLSDYHMSDVGVVLLITGAIAVGLFIALAISFSGSIYD